MNEMTGEKHATFHKIQAILQAFFTKVRENAQRFALCVTSKADVASEATTFGIVVI